MFDPRLWKPSAFNLTLDGRDGPMLFNSVSGQSLWLNGERRMLIDQCLNRLGSGEDGTSASPSEMVECLATMGFAVPAELDEYAAERARFRDHCDDESTLFLTIAPTMRCNMRCSYCFQQHIERNRNMAPDIQRGVLDFARRKAGKAKAMVVMWFGGEPLMAWAEIQSLTAGLQGICAEYGLSYYAEMVSNGLLLTPAIIAELPRLAIRAVQISLDGSVATYAERRHVALPRAEAYYRFLVENMQAIVEATGSVILRINVDRDNIDQAEDVVRLFKAQGMMDPRVDFRLGFLGTSRDVIDCIPHDCFTSTEFAEQEDRFRRFLRQEGYMVFGMPQPVTHPCTAPLRNGFTIDPDGNIGKCVPATGTMQSVFASIHPDDMDQTMREIESRAHPYQGFDPFGTTECVDCALLPSCLGSCPKLHVNGVLTSCSLKENLNDKMSFYGSFHHARILEPDAPLS
jgi:uncharacterized protein